MRAEENLTSAQQRYVDLFTSPEATAPIVRVLVYDPEDARIVSRGTLDEKVAMSCRAFERDCRVTEATGQDAVPMLHVSTGTEVFAAAFGSPVHRPEDSKPFALPAVDDAGGADALELPDVLSGPLGETFEWGDRLVAQYGERHPVRICDVQSPFGIAALIWQKERFLMALFETPDAAHRLLRKVTDTLIAYVREFLRRYAQPCLVHYPPIWMPPEWGMCLSEDEAGTISREHFVEFCAPYLRDLSEAFGGISLHCCARSEHVWPEFAALPGLRYVNLSHPDTSLVKAVETFSGQAALLPSCSHERLDVVDLVRDAMAHATPETRFIFVRGASSLDEARALYDRLCEAVAAGDDRSRTAGLCNRSATT